MSLSLTDMARSSAADVPESSEDDGRHGAHYVAERQEASRTENNKHLYSRHDRQVTRQSPENFAILKKIHNVGQLSKVNFPLCTILSKVSFSKATFAR